MSTKYTKPDIAPTSLNDIFRANIPDDFELPTCGIEDVDRAVFNLFNEQLPLFYKKEGEQTRVPVIFATGERAFVLRRNKPITDRSGALILPLVSILRSDLTQETPKGFGIGPGNGSLVISKRKFADSIDYFNEQNAEGLLNQDNVVNSNKNIGPSLRNYRRNLGGAVVKNEVSSQITEIISIPPPRYFSATYEVAIWAQYLQQMNKLLEAIMSSYNLNPAKSFKLETDKGYWFVGFVEDSFSSEVNFDGMTDSERIVKYNLSISVNGYIINPKFHGSQNTVRRTLSAPKISFDTKFHESAAEIITGIPSSNLDHYINSDLENVDEPLPGRAVGGKRIPHIGPPNSTSGNVEGIVDSTDFGSATIGGFSPPEKSEFVRTESYIDPFTGKRKYKTVLIKTKKSRHGETVHSLTRIE